MSAMKLGIGRACSVLKAATLTSCLLVAAQAHAEDIQLGFVGDLSGSPNAALGVAAVVAIETAIEDVNKAGGVLGRKFSLVVRDDQAKPDRSIQAATELVKSIKVSALFGPTHSGNAAAWKRIPTQDKVPVLLTVAENTTLTQPVSAGADNYFFRIGLYDRAYAAAFVAYAIKSGAKNVGILSETTGYGEGGLKDLMEISKARNLNVVANDKFAVADTDMTSQLIKMQSAGVDTLFVWAQGGPTAQLLRSMEKLNYFPKTLGAGGVNIPAFFDAAGPKLAALPMSTRVFVTPDTDAQKQLFERIKGKIPDPTTFVWSAQSYDAVLVLAAAMRQAGTTGGDKVREALENLNEKVSGTVKIYDKPFSRSNHEALQPAEVQYTKWIDNKLSVFHDQLINSMTRQDFEY